MEFSHIPVLLQPCLDGLNIDPMRHLPGWHGRRRGPQQRNCKTTDHRPPDFTRPGPGCGGSSHRKAQGSPAQVVQVNFREAARVLAELGIPAVNGALLDLGVSATSWTMPQRGFPIMQMPRWICA